MHSLAQEQSHPVRLRMITDGGSSQPSLAVPKPARCAGCLYLSFGTHSCGQTAEGSSISGAWEQGAGLAGLSAAPSVCEIPMRHLLGVNLDQEDKSL